MKPTGSADQLSGRLKVLFATLIAAMFAVGVSIDRYYKTHNPRTPDPTTGHIHSMIFDHGNYQVYVTQSAAQAYNWFVFTWVALALAGCAVVVIERRRRRQST